MGKYVTHKAYDSCWSVGLVNVATVCRGPQDERNLLTN